MFMSRARLVSTRTDRLPPSAHNVTAAVRLLMFFASSRLTEKTFYLAFDWKDWFASTGGYLGLLLGHSLLSFYDLPRMLRAKFNEMMA